MGEFILTLGDAPHARRIVIPNRLAVAVYRSINFRYRFTLDEDLLLFDFRIAGTNPVSRVSTSEAGTVDLTNELYGLSLGTKLDLARAYLDMGDPEGARSMLQEVLAEGNDTQKGEAKRLLADIG